MPKLTFEDAKKALKVIEHYCDESLEEIPDELRTIKDEEQRLKLMDRYARIKQARDFAIQTFSSLFNQIDPKEN